MNYSDAIGFQTYVQGHSRPPLSVPIASQWATS